MDERLRLLLQAPSQMDQAQAIADYFRGGPGMVKPVGVSGTQPLPQMLTGQASAQWTDQPTDMVMEYLNQMIPQMQNSQGRPALGPGPLPENDLVPPELMRERDLPRRRT